MRLIVDTEKCVGHGFCESIAPDVFEVQDQGFVEITREHFDDSDHTTMLEAVSRCPANALKITP
jgi:ferredoxin